MLIAILHFYIVAVKCCLPSKDNVPLIVPARIASSALLSDVAPRLSCLSQRWAPPVVASGVVQIFSPLLGELARRFRKMRLAPPAHQRRGESSFSLTTRSNGSDGDLIRY